MRTPTALELLDRAFSPPDRPLLLEIERDAGDAAWSSSQLAHFLEQDRMVFRVIAHRAEVDVPICFYVLQYDDDSLYVANLVVAPGWRRQGVASFALRGVEGVALELGCELIFLDVQERNLAAQLLYRAHGFRAVAIESHGYGNQDRYRMEKRLTGSGTASAVG